MKKFLTVLFVLTIFVAFVATAQNVRAQQGDTCRDAKVGYFGYESQAAPSNAPTINGNFIQMRTYVYDLEVGSNFLKVVYDGFGFLFLTDGSQVKQIFFEAPEQYVVALDPVFNLDDEIIDLLFVTREEPTKVRLASNGHSIMTLQDGLVDIDIQPTAEGQWQVVGLNSRGTLYSAQVELRTLTTGEYGGLRHVRWDKVAPSVQSFIFNEGGLQTEELISVPSGNILNSVYDDGRSLTFTIGQEMDGFQAYLFPVFTYTDATGENHVFTHAIIEMMIDAGVWDYGCPAAS